jgi:nucleoside-diphosphate-sugar epimerase
VKTVLVTGATGVVGTELVGNLRQRDDIEVVASSRRGAPSDGVIAWNLGREAPPPELRRPFDVVVHAAAATRWNQAPAQAWAANVEGTAAAMTLLGPDTHLVHVSTAFAVSRYGDTKSTQLDDYRNAYEWSKAASERLVAEHLRTTIVRPPLIIGRRSDGRVTRFSGLYVLARALVSGMAPAFVGDPKSKVEMVPVDDVAIALTDALDQGPGGDPIILGCGGEALTTQELVVHARDSLNRWRQDHGASLVDAPPIVSAQRWERFFLPFARSVLSDKQLRTLELLAEFIPYVSLVNPPQPTRLVEPVHTALDRAVAYWAETNPRAALAEQRPWRAERVDEPDRHPESICV